MSLACKCDKCGKFYERDDTFNKRKYKLCELRNSLEIDLCKDCYSELEEWFTECIQVRDCIHCKYSKDGKINSHETCHECMWENQFEPMEDIKGTCVTCKFKNCSDITYPCSACTDYSNYIKERSVE